MYPSEGMERMVDSITMAVATTLANKAAEVAFQGGRAAWESLVRLVRERIAHDPQATTALDTAQAHPGDRSNILLLASALQRIADEDADFCAELRGLWLQAKTELTDNSGVVNSNVGTVSGHLIQGRDFTVEGGLHLGDSPQPPHSAP